MHVHGPSNDLSEQDEWNNEQLDGQPHCGNYTAGECTDCCRNTKNDCDTNAQSDLVANNCCATLALWVVTPHLFPPHGAQEVDAGTNP